MKSFRILAEEVITDINKILGKNFGIEVKPLMWEKDVYPSVGSDPQDIINKQLDDYQIVIGILGDTLGSPTKRADSGTVEEILNGMKKRTDDPNIHIMVYFKIIQKISVNGNSIKEFERVNDFKQYFSKEGLYGTFKTKIDFQRELRNHLEMVLIKKFIKGTDEIELKQDLNLEISNIANDMYKCVESEDFEKIYYLIKNSDEILRKKIYNILLMVEESKTSYDLELVSQNFNLYFARNRSYLRDMILGQNYFQNDNQNIEVKNNYLSYLEEKFMEHGIILKANPKLPREHKISDQNYSESSNTLETNRAISKWYYHMKNHEWKKILELCKNNFTKQLLLSFFEGDGVNPGIHVGSGYVRFYSKTLNIICRPPNLTLLKPNSQNKEIAVKQDEVLFYNELNMKLIQFRDQYSNVIVDPINEIIKLKSKLWEDDYFYAFMPNTQKNFTKLCNLIDVSSNINKNHFSIKKGSSHINISKNEFDEYELHLIYRTREENIGCERKINLQNKKYYDKSSCSAPSTEIIEKFCNLLINEYKKYYFST
jgi:hypothetical protein